jgi:hypothetical protein
MSDIQATFSALSQIPSLLGDIRSGVHMLNTLASAGPAMATTGSPPASAAIGTLNMAILYLLADLVKGIDDDIDGMQQVQQNYRNNEDTVTQLAGLGMRLLNETSRADRPSLDGRGDGRGGCFGTSLTQSR